MSRLHPLTRRILGGFLVFLGLAMVVFGLKTWPDADSRVLAWMPEIRQACAESGIDPFLLAGLVYAESRGDEDAVSSIGALGLCQLMPPTAAELAGQMGIPDPPYSAADNLRMGARYLSKMLRRHDGDVDLALLSYRLGPTGVDRRIQAAGGKEAWFQDLQGNLPSPWGYRDQILEAQTRYAAMPVEEDLPAAASD
ncbi:MAG: lytic transglycosylase domain-containing protein [Planctomycetota bacterium]